MLGERVEIRGGPGRRSLIVPWHATPADIAAAAPGADVRRLAATLRDPVDDDDDDVDLEAPLPAVDDDGVDLDDDLDDLDRAQEA